MPRAEMEIRGRRVACFGILWWCSLMAVIQGSPSLISNVDSFTGVLCETPVKFTCHTFEPVVGFDWYIDDNILVSYTYRGESLPVFPSTNRSLLDAEVVISTAVPVNNGNVDYGNVTLTTTLNSLTQIQGSNISCGIFFQRSNFIMIDNYTIDDGNFAVSYSAVYVDVKLVSIKAQWKDVFERSICSSTTIYNININTNQELLLNQTMSTADCMSSSDKYCSIQLFVNDTTEVYHVLVTARNLGNFRNNFTSYTVIGNSTGNEISICNRNVSIMCSKLTNNTCTINTTQAINEAQPGDTYSLVLDEDIDVVYVTSKIGLTMILQEFSIANTKRNHLFAAIGVPIFFLGLCILISGYTVGIIQFFRLRVNDSQKSQVGICKMTSCFGTVSGILAAVLLVLWISIAITAARDVCHERLQLYHIVSIIAFVFSILLLIFGTLVFSGFLLINAGEKTNKDKENTEIKFGAEKPSNKDIGDNCVICDVKFTSNVKTFSDAVKQFTKRKCEWKKCWACNEVMCENCTKEAFLKYCNDWKNVCSNCYEEYKKEKDRQSDLPKMRDSPPKRSKTFNNKICPKCNRRAAIPSEVNPDKPSEVNPDKPSEVNPDKPSEVNPDKTSEVNPDKPSELNPDEQHFRVNLCPRCQEWICEDCTVLQAVPGNHGHLEFLCRDCFAHYNMTKDTDKGNTDDESGIIEASAVTQATNFSEGALKSLNNDKIKSPSQGKEGENYQTVFDTQCKISDSGTTREDAHNAGIKTHKVDEPLSINESHF